MAKKLRAFNITEEPPPHLVLRCQRYLETVLVPEALREGQTLIYAISRYMAKQLQIIEELCTEEKQIGSEFGGKK